MQWSADNTIPAIQGKSLKLRELFAKVANASLDKGFSKEEAIFAGTNAVKIEERKNAPAKVKKPVKPSHVESLRSYTNPFEVVSKAETQTLSSDIKTAEFDKDGRLVISMSDGKKITSKNTIVEKNIEQNIAIAPNVQLFSSNDSVNIVQEGQNFDLTTATSNIDVISSDGTVLVSQTGQVFDLSVSGASSTTTLVIQVRNQTGATLTKGTAVYISGASGNKALVSKALATSDATSAQTLGLVSADIITNQNGYVTIVGLVSGLNTLAFAEGTQLYLSPTVAGTYTATKPHAPDHLVYIGVVTRSHQNQGAIEVKVQNGYELDEIHDVQIVNPTNGQILAYDAASDLWKNTNNNATFTAGDGLTLTGNQFNVGGTADRIAVNTDSVDIASTYAGQTSITTLGTIGTGTWNATTIGVSKGGTGLTTIAALSIPVANSLNTYTSVTPAAGQSIRINLANNAWEAYTPSIGTITDVTGTAPIVSSGGTAPAISISAATTSAAGSMSAADKTKLDGIDAGAQVNVATNLAEGTRTTTTVPITSSTGTSATLSAATTALAGVMTSADKTKLDGIDAGATNVTNTNQLINGAGFITSSGIAANVSGTVAVANGGTGLTTIAALSIPVANVLNTYTSVTPAAGQSVRINAGNTAWEAYTPSTGTITDVTGTAPIISSGGTAPAISISAATTSAAGSMSAADKTKLDGIAAGATNVTNTNQLTNGAGFITSSGTAANVSGTVAVANGGTGLTTLTARGIIYGNGTSAVGVTAASNIDGSFLTGDSSGNPYWSNLIDGGTY